MAMPMELDMSIQAMQPTQPTENPPSQQADSSKEEKEDPPEPAVEQWRNNIANTIQKLAVILFNRPILITKS